MGDGSSRSFSGLSAPQAEHQIGAVREVDHQSSRVNVLGAADGSLAQPVATSRWGEMPFERLYPGRGACSFARR